MPIIPSISRAGVRARGLAINTMSILENLQNQLLAHKEVVFPIKVRPNAAKTEFKSMMDDGTIKMNVAAVPEDGKANKELIRFLSKSFDVETANIEILLGQTSPLKRVRIMV